MQQTKVFRIEQCDYVIVGSKNKNKLRLRFIRALLFKPKPFVFPAGLCPDWDQWDQTKPVDNAREAMQQADDWLGIPQVK